MTAEIKPGKGFILEDVLLIIKSDEKINFVHKNGNIVQEDIIIVNKSGGVITEYPVSFQERGYQYLDSSIQYKIEQPAEVIEYALLLYSNNYCHANYEHLILDVFPKVYVHSKEIIEKNVKLIIPSSSFDKVILEFLELVGVKEDNILIIHNEWKVKVKYLFEFVSHGTYPFDKRPIDFFKFLREKITKGLNENDFLKYVYLKQKKSLKGENKELKKIYLGRKKGDIVGKGRFISNSKELEKFLDQQGFQFIDVATMNFKEKVTILSESDVVISEIGANCNNILISNNIQNFVMIGHNKFKKLFYKDIFDELNEDSNSIILFCEPDDKNHDVYNSVENVNIPFHVDIGELENIINKF